MVKQEIYSYVVRPNCYEIFCSQKSLTIKIFTDYIVCPRAGGKIYVNGYYGYLLCPDYNLMCSGTVICNDMFDCVEKNSITKEDSYEYDYTIKTSQNIQKSRTAEADNTDNYELSTDGVCPQYCSHCNEGKKCLKCKDGYGLTPEESEQIICIIETSLNEGYYKDDNNIYRKCPDTCKNCLNSEVCIECNTNYIFNDENKCITPQIDFVPIENCIQYKGMDLSNCNKCEENFGFNQTFMDKCLSIETDLAGYYTMNNINYYPCEEKISDCSKCHYFEEINDVICDICNDDFILLIEGEITTCFEKEKLENNTEYYKIDETQYRKCSDAIEHCISCENVDNCTLCLNQYEFNSTTKKCEKENASPDIDDISYYFNCKNRFLLELMYILFFLAIL